MEKDKWKLLANVIKETLCNQNRIFQIDPEIEKMAEHYAALILEKRLQQAAENIESSEKSDENENRAQYESVDIHSVSTSNARTQGAEHVAVKQMDEYGFDNILRDLQFDDKQIIYTKMLIAGRMVHPASERETVRWINENSAIKELLRTDVKVYDNALHRTAIKLWQYHEAIEKQLSKSAVKMFSLEESVILYDLTNTYFEGSKRGSWIAKPGGCSKERRNDRPLITLALTVDEEGFPKQSWLLDGNVSEPGTLERMLNDLSEYTETNLFNSKKTIVMDAGIATDDNLKIIKSKNYNYVAVSRKQSYGNNFWDDSKEKQLELKDDKTKLKIKMVRTDDESFLLCHSEMKEAKERAILERKLKKFEEGLKNLKDGLKKKGTQKKYSKIIERIGRLKEKCGVGTLYDIDVKEKDGVAVEIEFSKNSKGEAKECRAGEYVIRTNRLDLSGERISQIHRSLTRIENCFCSMKSELGMRPNYHKEDDPAIAHIAITVIAYHILSGILKKLRIGGVNYRWETLRNILSSHVRITTNFNTEKNETIHIRTSTTPSIKQREIYRKLKIKMKPLKRVVTKFKKSVVPKK
ncbi:MAG: IS1634 family transposase [Candidatus Marinimicrobia bacterium]|nr:IS1634 family transposase [Candidatus Neomarinimicrobiota bacterium]